MVLGTSGPSFTRDGQLVTYCGFSEFRLLDRFLRGEDIQPLFDDRTAVLAEVQAQAAHTGDGAWLLPVLRIFCMADSFMQLRPAQHATYYTSVSALTDFCLQHAFVPKWEYLADCQIVLPLTADQQRHCDQMDAALAGRTALRSKGNEAPKNGWKSDAVHLAAGGPWSQGSNLGGDYPPLPAGTFSDYHPRRDGIKGIAANGRYLCFVSGGDDEATPPFSPTHPVISDEWLGAADQDDHGRRSRWPDDFYRAGLDMAAWSAGGTFHSDCGLQSVVFSAQQRACAQAFVMGLAKVDPVQRFQGRVR